jgi:hypothetical protein
MLTRLAVLIAALSVLVAVTASAELQNVTVGGAVKIRGNYYSPAFGYYQGGGIYPNVRYRWRGLVLSGRPTGAGFGYADLVGDHVRSAFAWNDDLKSDSFVRQRTRLNVRADFTDEVNAFIEFDSNDQWGEDFRSNYATGVDGRALTNDDIEVYQSYIETTNTFGAPLRLRIGRQELSFGNEWLVGRNDGGMKFFGISFDAVRATYATDLFSVDAFAAKLAERSPLEEDGDTDFYGLYGSYLGVENFTFDAYWFFLRDALGYRDTNGLISNLLEDAIGRDDYDPVELHTVGLRAAGDVGNLGFHAEAAYQFGDAGRIGGTFRPFNLLNFFFGNAMLLGRNRYGDDNAEFAAWGGDAMVEYTFSELPWAPRVFLNVAYYGGEDNRDVSFLEWLNGHVNPFYEPTASISFNRLFSDVEYSKFLEIDASLSNAWIAGGGVSVLPTENIEALLTLYHFESLEAFSSPYHFNVGGIKIVPFFPFSFVDQKNDTDLGWELAFQMRYNYSDDLSLTVGWAHLFVGDGLSEGNFSDGYGLLFNGGTNNDDPDYFFAQTNLKF